METKLIERISDVTEWTEASGQPPVRHRYYRMPPSSFYREFSVLASIWHYEREGLFQWEVQKVVRVQVLSARNTVYPKVVFSAAPKRTRVYSCISGETKSWEEAMQTADAHIFTPGCFRVLHPERDQQTLLDGPG